MTINKLSDCRTIDQLNKFLQEKVEVQVGASIGRKFKIGQKSYTLNQIWQQYEKCVKYDRQHGAKGATSSHKHG